MVKYIIEQLPIIHLEKKFPDFMVQLATMHRIQAASVSNFGPTIFRLSSVREFLHSAPLPPPFKCLLSSTSIIVTFGAI